MPAGPGNYNRLIWSPGEAIKWPGEGGVILLSPPNRIAGSMTRTDMENRVWHLLREPGPDTGQPPPQTGDFAQTIVDRDLNIALAQFLSQCGWAPKLSERFLDFPVFPGLDYPLPPDLQSLTRIDYTIAGQTPYKLIPLSWEDFDRKLGDQIPASTGNPYYYRVPFAGYIRLQPQPTQANFLGPGLGTIVLGGAPTVGDKVFTTLTNPGFPSVITQTYTTVPSDSLGTIASAMAQFINNSAAVQGPTKFLQPAVINRNQVVFNAINAPGTNITYFATVASLTMTVTPNSAATLSPQGDIMTFYYTSTGSIMLLPNDTPGIPPQYHMALVYRVLMDYWRRKQDLTMAKEYERMYKDAVLEGKKLELDSERETQFTIAGVDDSELYGTPGVPY